MLAICNQGVKKCSKHEKRRFASGSHGKIEAFDPIFDGVEMREFLSCGAQSAGSGSQLRINLIARLYNHIVYGSVSCQNYLTYLRFKISAEGKVNYR